ncbi:MAG: hypothetical protein AAFQ27_11755, partial [Pseudomonadota bacterium]
WMIVATAALSACSLTPEQKEREVERGILSDPATRPMWESIKQHHPEEFDGLLKKIASLPDSKLTDSAFMAQVGAKWVIDLQTENVPFAAQAPAANVLALTSADLELYQSLRERSVAECAVLSTSGSFQGDTETDRMTKSLMSKRNVAFFDAVAAGRKDPQGYETPSDADFGDLGSAMVDIGINDRSMAALGDMAALMSLSDEEQCDIGVAVNQAVLTFPEDKGAEMAAFLLAASVDAP